jgi:hypothetical protein
MNRDLRGGFAAASVSLAETPFLPFLYSANATIFRWQ